jgi:hypothetical protein
VPVAVVERLVLFRLFLVVLVVLAAAVLVAQPQERLVL